MKLRLKYKETFNKGVIGGNTVDGLYFTEHYVKWIVLVYGKLNLKQYQEMYKNLTGYTSCIATQQRYVNEFVVWLEKRIKRELKESEEK